MALTQYYVDPSIAGDSGTGTISDPFGDLQYALNTITRDAVNGDQINIKAGTAEVLAASLTLATYGTPTDAAPLVIRGYTAAANDGGRGDLNGNAGAFPIFLSAYNYVHVIDMICRNVGDAHLLSLGNQAIVMGCIVHTAAKNDGYGISVGQGAFVANNHVYNVRGRGINMFGAGVALGNYVQDGATYDVQAIFTGGQTGSMVLGNVIRLQRAGSAGIHCFRGWGTLISGNVVYQSAAGTSNGISSGTFEAYAISVLNNIICGFSGAGGKGIFADDKHPSAVGHNAFYNCTTNEQYDAYPLVDLGGDVALAADPFVDAANGDFSLTAAAKTALAAKGWPLAYFGAHANTVPNLNIGPIQMAAGGGGGAVSISPWKGMIG